MAARVISWASSIGRFVRWRERAPLSGTSQPKRRDGKTTEHRNGCFRHCIFRRNHAIDRVTGSTSIVRARHSLSMSSVFSVVFICRFRVNSDALGTIAGRTDCKSVPRLVRLAADETCRIDMPVRERLKGADLAHFPLKLETKPLFRSPQR